MRSAGELNDKELLIAYASVCKRSKQLHKEKLDLEEEMAKRYEKELEEKRSG